MAEETLEVERWRLAGIEMALDHAIKLMRPLQLPEAKRERDAAQEAFREIRVAHAQARRLLAR